MVAADPAKQHALGEQTKDSKQFCLPDSGYDQMSNNAQAETGAELLEVVSV